LSEPFDIQVGCSAPEFVGDLASHYITIPKEYSEDEPMNFVMDMMSVISVNSNYASCPYEVKLTESEKYKPDFLKTEDNNLYVDQFTPHYVEVTLTATLLATGESSESSPFVISVFCKPPTIEQTLAVPSSRVPLQT